MLMNASGPPCFSNSCSVSSMYHTRVFAPPKNTTSSTALRRSKSRSQEVQGSSPAPLSAGATAGWLLRYGKPADLTPAQIVVTGQMPALQAFLVSQGLRFTW